jgi:ribosome-associated protein YbcJ (S4-like RNA binding protein)
VQFLTNTDSQRYLTLHHFLKSVNVFEYGSYAIVLLSTKMVHIRITGTVRLALNTF